ncbi:MTH1187 family thiamine-binding protein [Caminibacter mediatlanticus TB-2]|uniref:MTH1187 family thiamine-binding protein n=1 Tax=Caminibacter mediatlanticus TB-2 TaxID=391592 RepID=A0ABX5V8Q3_9BACT|nr:MTH1187 family thiamine-binding protein [Caminibacter mediatlanticus]QCT94653.1 MTH1187 family thiamine-binding protein [Caminibacter mediatlanticus TB-2]
MSVLVEFAMFPTDKGESVSEYVSRIIKMFKESNINYQLTPMGTIFEVDTIEEATNIINNAYKQLERDCNRVYTTIKMDIRKNKNNRMKQKIKSIESKIGKVNG